MANAAIAYENKADAGTWSATSAETLMPVSRLQGEHVSQRWRSASEPATITVDLLDDEGIDTIALFGLTTTVAALFRVMVSTAAGGAASGNLHDVTYDLNDPEYAAAYGSLVVLLPAAVNGRYVRIVITDAAEAYVEAGRGFVGTRQEFTYNFAPGSSITWNDNSRKTKTAGGQTLVYPDRKFRSVEVNFDWVTESQRDVTLEAVDRINGQSTDVLLILDTEDTTYLARYSIWGLITQAAPVLYTNLDGIFSRTYSIEERL